GCPGGGGVGAAWVWVRVGAAPRNPTSLSMARYALGLVLKKTEPARALELFDDAAELAASVRNSWWHTVSVMEAAATRAVHGDPAAAARGLVDVLDRWERLGDRTQQWLSLRYAVRLLARIGARDDAVVLHHAISAAGRPSPLDPARLAALAAAQGAQAFVDSAGRGAALSGADAVDLARTVLRRVG
ncbi:MAG: hypothetical protein ACT4RN_24180, partial [Pseudonocardia sp.]